MNSIALALFSLLCITGGAYLGFFLSRHLPRHHLDADSKDAIKMAWGIVATMSALVLSLLIASAKNSFDTINTEATQASAKVLVLDHVLSRYGPETGAAREQLHNSMVSVVDKIWPETMAATPTTDALEKSNGMENVQDRLNELVPATETQRALLAQARGITDELLMSRWLVIAQSRTMLPDVFYVILISWLSMLFIGIGLFAPCNKTVLIALFLCNLSFSAAIFLLNEMNHPLDGFMKISSAPMYNALEHLGR
jgi:hypothetical protein